MNKIAPRDAVLDYSPCRYGKSKLLFRGPRRDLRPGYIAILGGTETYGKFVARPFADLVSAALGTPIVNLGCVNAGVDAFANDPEVVDIAARAQVTVIQILGAHNLSNRLFTVHPRRNDRFVHASAGLRSLFPEVEFTEFHFNRHVLQALHSVSADRFEVVAAELRMAWVARMRLLLSRMTGRKLLLWISENAPPEGSGRPTDILRDPILIDARMIAELRADSDGYVEHVIDPASRAQTEGMIFAPADATAARFLPGPTVHRDIAADLVRHLQHML